MADETERAHFPVLEAERALATAVNRLRSRAHKHSELTCYSKEPMLVCEAMHMHNDSCFQRQKTCGRVQDVDLAALIDAYDKLQSEKGVS